MAPSLLLVLVIIEAAAAAVAAVNEEAAAAVGPTRTGATLASKTTKKPPGTVLVCPKPAAKPNDGRMELGAQCKLLDTLQSTDQVSLRSPD